MPIHSSSTSAADSRQRRFLASLGGDAQFCRLLNHLSGVAFFAKNTSFELMLANARFYRRLGLESEADVVGRTDFELFPKPLAEKFRADDKRVLETGQPLLHLVELFLDPQGLPDWFVTNKLPLFDRSGKPAGIMGTVQRYERQQDVVAADPAVARAANAFREKPGERWSLREVARHVGLSQRQFDRKFKESYGVTPQDYLMKTRIQAACAALRRPGARPAEVALECGFYDQSAFTAQFRRHMGITPRAYIARHQGI